MQAISGDTWAVWIADDGLDRSHGAELLLYSPPDPVAGDVSAVWVAEGGYQWSHDDQLEELTTGTILSVPSLSLLLPIQPVVPVAGAFLSPSALSLLLHQPAPGLSSDLILLPRPLSLLLSLHLPTPIAGANLPVPQLPLQLHVPAPRVALDWSGQAPSLPMLLHLPAPWWGISQVLQVPQLPLLLHLRSGHLLVVPSVTAPGQTVYDLTLTGAADGQPDVVLPMSTFQGRLRDGTPSYLQVTVPNAAAWADAVTQRPNGQLVVRKGKRFADGSRQMEEIARVNLETIADDRGGRSQTLTLSGHLTTAASDPKPVALAGLTYRHAGTGQRRYRGRLDSWLRPGDTAVIAEYGEKVVVGLITYVVQARPASETMEITEA